ncbi:MAG: hypothetical protein WBG46_07730 [Nonlabens sp.]
MQILKNIIILIVVAVSTFSCSSDNQDDLKQQTQYAHERFGGIYILKNADVVPALDIDFDGIAQNDLFSEVNYCDIAKYLENYYLIMKFKEREINSLKVEIPINRVPDFYEIQQSCLTHTMLGYNITIDESSQLPVIVYDEHWAQVESNHRAKLIDLNFYEDRVDLVFERQFFNSQDVWQDVTLYMTFERLNDPS